MVNAWTWGLLAGTAVAAALTLLLALALRRRPPAVGLGVLLVPVTGLWLWAFGITAEDQQTVTSRTFTAMIAVGDAVSRALGGAAGPLGVRTPKLTITPTTLAIPPGHLVGLVPAGPTIVVIEVPCELSWPKISTC